MIPEAVIAMLACGRIGAIHSVVFGGFAAAELAVRIDDATPRAILAGSCGIEPNKIIEFIKNLDDKYQSILIIGHNPTLHALIEKLTNELIKKFATCNLANITSKNFWKDTSFGSCELKSLIKPKEIKIEKYQN